MTMNPSLGINPQVAALMYAGAASSIVVGVLAIISGVGLIKNATWGSGCALAYGIVAILGSFLFMLIMYRIGQAKGQATSTSLFSALVGGFLRGIYPIVLLCFLKSAKWKEAFVAIRSELA